ncbi:MAG: chorismate mutase [Patescibacteria group bacterium]
MLRALRGAITVERDEPEAILSATRDLLAELVRANGLHIACIVSAIFTATPDLRAEYPAAAARQLGWNEVPLLDAVEIDKPGGLPRCVRVLLHAEMDPGVRPVHVYLRGAAALRPDLSNDE